jgi:hypothetical protein
MLSTELLLLEFSALLQVGNRREAFELIEPELSSGNLRLALAYATAKVEEGDGLAAAALLKQYEQHCENSHYALLTAVAARLATRQIGEWGARAERQLVHVINSNPEHEGLLHQLQHYMRLCLTCDVPCHPEIRAALARYERAAPEADNLAKAIFLGYRDGNLSNSKRIVVVPAAPVFIESDDISWRPMVAHQSILDVGEQDFKAYQNVRLYMLPFMYGLIEVEAGVFLGDLIGGCNPYTQSIVTHLGGHIYKSLGHPLLAAHPERTLKGTHMLPFRLAGTYYFHFAVETLQTISEVGPTPKPIPIILPKSPGFFDRIPRHVHDSAVEAVRVKGQLYEFLEDGIYQLDEAVVPTRIKYGSITYQERVLDALGITDLGTTCKNEADVQILYIARRPGMVRSVTNEEDIVTCLAARFSGFSRIYLEDMSFADQIVAFRSATIIIAPHGGGLTNIIFCRAGTAVIEFQLPQTGIMYWHIAVMQRLRYLAYVPRTFNATTLNYLIQPDRLIAAIDVVAGFSPLDPSALAHM